jgi:hypothetical protein
MELCMQHRIERCAFKTASSVNQKGQHSSALQCNRFLTAIAAEAAASPGHRYQQARQQAQQMAASS